MNFLYGVFGKSGKTQKPKYDKITFKINLSDHIPQFYENSSQKIQVEQQLTPDNPIYFELFPKNEQNYVMYQVKENDTIFGLAIKLDMSEKVIRQINDLSGSIYPGMTIKLPEGTDLQQLENQRPSEMQKRLRISQLLSSEKTSAINQKYTVYYYVGLSGYIKGALTINQNYVIFNPLLEEEENLVKFTVQKLLKFNVLVETVDIAKAEFLEIPMIDEFSSSEVPKLNSVVQFMLYKVGNSKIEKKYKERLKQLKIDHKAIASISFSFDPNPNERQLAQEVCQIMNQIIEGNQKSSSEYEEKKRLTNIPFFDIIHENINPKEEKPKNQNHIIRQSAVLGVMNEQSDIIRPEQFENLAKGFPILYKLYNWNKAYSTRRDGSSFTTFLNKARYSEPAIFLVKQYKGSVMGAFLVESLQAGKTGRGEMFIFTFREDGVKPQIYQWTTKNEFFVYIEKDQGIGIGMGFKYGLFVRNTLDKGSSARTDTFGNPDMLSKKEDFLVDDVQIWEIDNSHFD